MSIRKVLCADARSIVGAVLRRAARACSGSGLPISVHFSVCVSMAIGVALSAGIAQAAIPSLPPLPAYLPLDEASSPSDARYDAPPLPRGTIAETPNPFRDDSPDDTAVSHTTPALADRTHTDDATDPADGSAPLGPQAAALSREAAATSSALEGPPVRDPSPGRVSMPPGALMALSAYRRRLRTP